jgi:hypothetical protein
MIYNFGGFMKRIVFSILMCGILFFTFTAASCDIEESSTTKNSRSNEQIAQAAQASVEVPIPQNFLERQNVAAWFKNWDVPGKITYLYIFTQQGCIGYFVCDGKPISNRSYLTPEEAYYMNGAVLQTPSLDGTYGEDLQGIRFKTAKGIWMEFGGTNFSYVYSDNPIPGLSQLNLTPRD